MTGPLRNGIEHYCGPSGELLAIVVRADCDVDGVHFVTGDDATLQLGIMRHESGHRVVPHVHHPVPRMVEVTQETLYVRRGRLRLDLYTAQCVFAGDCELRSGDVVLLVSGGHGFEMLEPTEMVEVKQGPYVGNRDKTRFDPAARAKPGM